MHGPGPEKSLRSHEHRAATQSLSRQSPHACALQRQLPHECPAAACGRTRHRAPAPRLQQPATRRSPTRRSSSRPTASRRRATARWLLQGDVLITAGRADAEDARCRRTTRRTQSFNVDEDVEYADPNLKVSGSSRARRPERRRDVRRRGVRAARTATRAAPRTASSVTRDGQLKLDGVRYTTCPVGDEDWVLRAGDIDISQRAGLGIGRGVRLDFKGVPILYTPFISFPVGNERKSGFLFPTIGTSSRSGYSLSVPWYWNIAPNYDATFMPTWYSQARRQARQRVPLPDRPRPRHARLPSTCPTTSEFGDSRSFVHFVDQSDFTDTLRLDIDAANVERQRTGSRTSASARKARASRYLNRSASLTYLDASLAGGAARAELPDDRRRRHPDPSCGRTPCCRSWQCAPTFPTSRSASRSASTGARRTSTHNYDDLRCRPAGAST